MVYMVSTLRTSPLRMLCIIHMLHSMLCMLSLDALHTTYTPATHLGAISSHDLHPVGVICCLDISWLHTVLVVYMVAVHVPLWYDMLCMHNTYHVQGTRTQCTYHIYHMYHYALHVHLGHVGDNRGLDMSSICWWLSDDLHLLVDVLLVVSISCLCSVSYIPC